MRRPARSSRPRALRPILKAARAPPDPLMLAVAAIALMRVQHEKQAAARWLCATAIDGSFSHALVETLGKVLASTA